MDRILRMARGRGAERGDYRRKVYSSHEWFGSLKCSGAVRGADGGAGRDYGFHLQEEICDADWGHRDRSGGSHLFAF